jgi:hypothetical protein
MKTNGKTKNQGLKKKGRTQMLIKTQNPKPMMQKKEYHNLYTSNYSSDKGAIRRKGRDVKEYIFEEKVEKKRNKFRGNSFE